jgi:hypothetical protein
MLVGDLIAFLEDCPQEAEVRLAMQPSWPFEYSIDSYQGPVVVDINPDAAPEPDDDDYEDFQIALAKGEIETTGTEELVVYLGEGTQIGYLPAKVSRELGW